MISLIFYFFFSFIFFQFSNNSTKNIPSESISDIEIKPYKAKIIFQLDFAVLKFKNDCFLINTGDTLSFDNADVFIELAAHIHRYKSVILKLNSDSVTTINIDIVYDKNKTKISEEILAKQKWSSSGAISTDKNTEVYLDDQFLGKNIVFLDYTKGILTLKNEYRSVDIDLQEYANTFLYLEYYLLYPKRSIYQIFVPGTVQFKRANYIKGSILALTTIGFLTNTFVQFENYKSSANKLNEYQRAYDNIDNIEEVNNARNNLINAKNDFNSKKSTYFLSYAGLATVFGYNIWDWIVNEPSKTRTINSFQPFIRNNQTKNSILESLSFGLNVNF